MSNSLEYENNMAHNPLFYSRNTYLTCHLFLFLSFSQVTARHSGVCRQIPVHKNVSSGLFIFQGCWPLLVCWKAQENPASTGEGDVISAPGFYRVFLTDVCADMRLQEETNQKEHNNPCDTGGIHVCD